MDLLVIPFHDWYKCEREGFRTRDAHFIQEFDKHPLIDKLVVINRPISFAEIIFKRLKRRHGAVQQVGKKTYIIDTVLPDVWQPALKRRHWIPDAYSQERTVAAVTSGLQKLGIHEYSVLTNEPIHVPLIQQLTPRVFVFDMTDNLLKHAAYRDMLGMRDYYDYCINYAEIITTNSPENTEWLKQKRPDTFYIPNGVDATRFVPGISYPFPEDMRGLPGPLVGFAGKMQEMIDVDLMIKTVKATPETHYIFIGQQLDRRHMSPLWRCPTVHYLGDKHYDELPRYLAAFDICIIPYHVNRQHGVDPIKFYEYMAMGKPIVTTNIGGVSTFRDYPQVIVADTEDGFAGGVKSFVDSIGRGDNVFRKNLPSNCFWNTKADFLLQTIYHKLQSQKM